MCVNLEKIKFFYDNKNKAEDVLKNQHLGNGFVYGLPNAMDL